MQPPTRLLGVGVASRFHFWQVYVPDLRWLPHPRQNVGHPGYLQREGEHWHAESEQRDAKATATPASPRTAGSSLKACAKPNAMAAGQHVDGAGKGGLARFVPGLGEDPDLLCRVDGTRRRRR